MRTALQIKRSSKLSSVSLGVLRDDETLEDSVAKESGFNLNNSKDLILTFLTIFWLRLTMFSSIIASLELTESILTCLKTVA